MRFVAVALFSAGVVAGSAEADTFYYVGGVYDFANVSRSSSTPAPTFSTAVVEIDEAQLPAGQTLTGLTVNLSEGPYNEETGTTSFTPSYFSLRLGNQAGSLFSTDRSSPMVYSGSYMTFDGAGMPSDWSIAPGAEFELGAIFTGQSGRGRDSRTEPFPGLNGGASEAEAARRFLTKRGYKERTPIYDEIVAAHTWVRGFGSSSGGQTGQWFTDPLAFSRQVEANAQYASRRPPSNVCKIPSAPKLD